jgi:Spy/CpxP family protein refolding chaperone
MENKSLKMSTGLAVTILLVLLPAVMLMAQPYGRGNGNGNGPGYGWSVDKNGPECRIPGLSDEQKAEIEKLRTAHIRKANLIRAEIGEKEARLNTLRLAEKEDVKAIDKTIDEISKLRGDLMKERESHKREVRALLNEDQKAWFDARPGRGKGDGYGKGNGRGNRAGYGGGRGYRNCPRN